VTVVPPATRGDTITSTGPIPVHPRATSLPEFSVRVSDRARRIRLTVTAREGLTVVVPRGWRGDAEALVASKRDWAIKALASVADRRALHVGGPDALLPSSVELPLLGVAFPVEYAVASGSSRARARTVDGRLVVTGPEDSAARLEALRRWLDRTAREALPQRLADQAATHGLTYSRVRITKARSRWGSCSGSGSISLNRSLLFLPPPLGDALILHELAHTRVMDHSPRFWSLLATLDPQAERHRRALREAGRLVPAWADV